MYIGFGANLRVRSVCVTELHGALQVRKVAGAHVSLLMSIASGLSSLRSRETVLIVLQLCLWSELGVLTRIYLDRLFNDGCGNGWGVCLTSQATRDKQYGAQFFDLPANMLGCFFMGFLSTASVLGLASKKSLTFLPASSRLQNEEELQVGLRTGYCGSLTTFASWELALVQLLIGSKGGDGGQWQQWLWGFIIGFELAYASHLIGEHAALGVHRWLLPEGSQDPDKEEVNRFERPSDAQEEGEDLYGSQELDEVIEEHQGHPQQDHSHAGAMSNSKLELTNVQRPSEAGEEAEDLYGTADSHQVLTARDSQSPTDLENGQPRHRKQPAKNDRGQQQTDRSSVAKTPSKAANVPVTTIVCSLLCFLLTALWIVLAIVDSERKHSGRRQQWFALLFAPFGCILRWLLSKLNTMQQRPLAWFPVGTFAANMIACCIDFILAALTNRYSLGYWPIVILPAIRVGYAGSLSTVSTFIAEVRAQLQGWPEKLHGYLYPFVTIATANVLGIVLYGWSVWRTL